MSKSPKSFRLSHNHIKIVEKLAKEHEKSFTGAIRHIISEYAETQQKENSISRLIQELDKKIQAFNPSATKDSIVEDMAILEELNNIGNNLHLVLKALLILGSANSRTAGEIEELLEDIEE